MSRRSAPKVLRFQQADSAYLASAPRGLLAPFGLLGACISRRLFRIQNSHVISCRPVLNFNVSSSRYSRASAASLPAIRSLPVTTRPNFPALIPSTISRLNLRYFSPIAGAIGNMAFAILGARARNLSQADTSNSFQGVCPFW